MHVNAHDEYISAQCVVPRVSYKVKCGLWVTMMCQDRLISCQNRTTLLEGC